MSVPVAVACTGYISCHQIKQLKNDAPAGTIHPTQHLLVLDVYKAAESVCASEFGLRSHLRAVTPYVFISNTLKPRLHQSNILRGNMLLVAGNMLPWCKRGFRL